MPNLFLINLFVIVNSFTTFSNHRITSTSLSQLNYKKKDLKYIDIKIQLYKNRMKKLLQDKNTLFKNISGLKMHNDTEIDEYLNNMINNKRNIYDDDDDDEDINYDDGENINYEDDDEYDDEDINYDNQNKKPKFQIIIQTKPIHNNENNENNLKSENFEILKNT